jgi:DNA modification methylase
VSTRSDRAAAVYQADCVDLMRTLLDSSVHAIVTDPPYGLADHKPAAVVTALTAWANGDRESVPNGKGFMGRDWDAFVPPPAVWDECLRVLKPGGHLLCFAGTRTVDLMGLSIRLAGFEIRDSLTWMYGSGFPKSMDVSKSIDKAAGAAREVIGQRDRYLDGQVRQNLGDRNEVYGQGLTANGVADITAPATAAARQWAGWGTALKPASEPIIVARKPLVGTVAANVQEHGTGGINVDASRVAGEPPPSVPRGKFSGSNNNMHMGGRNGEMSEPHVAGRWPANVVLSHGPECDGGCQPGCPVAELEAQGTGTRAAKPSKSGPGGQQSNAIYGGGNGLPPRHDAIQRDDSGASRFFPVFRYQAKAPTKERPKVDGKSHPTVKPLALMRWLVRLVTPPGGTVLDPFAGSGTTGEAALLEGFSAILIEREPSYLPMIQRRIDRAGTPRSGAQWRSRDPKERARAAGLDPDQVAAVRAETPGQIDLFNLISGEAS